MNQALLDAIKNQDEQNRNEAAKAYAAWIQSFKDRVTKVNTELLAKANDAIQLYQAMDASGLNDYKHDEWLFADGIKHDVGFVYPYPGRKKGEEYIAVKGGGWCGDFSVSIGYKKQGVMWGEAEYCRQHGDMLALLDNPRELLKMYNEKPMFRYVLDWNEARIMRDLSFLEALFTTLEKDLDAFCKKYNDYAVKKSNYQPA